MSARRRERTESTAIQLLLHTLADAAAQSPACDSIPGDFAVPAAPVRAIHATVDAAGTAAVASLPPALRAITRSRRRDLLGIAWSLTALAPEGQGALRVPESLLAEATQGHGDMRRQLVEGGRLHGVLRLMPETGRSRAATVVLLLGPADVAAPIWFGGTDAPLDPASGPEFDQTECIARWRERRGSERDRMRSDSSFLVPRTEIAAAGFDLTPAPYRTVHAAIDAMPPRHPHEILAELAGLEAEILQGIRELAGLLRP